MEGYQVIQKMLRQQTIHTSLLGRVTAYNPTKRTATVAPLVEVDGQTLPLLIEVPVVTHSVGDFSIYVPVQPGDIAVILFLDRDSDDIILQGQGGTPSSTRVHSLDDALLLGTISPLSTTTPPTDPTALTLSTPKSEVSLTPEGDITLQGEHITLRGRTVTIQEGKGM